jgi:hypothetical protein
LPRVEQGSSVQTKVSHSLRGTPDSLGQAQRVTSACGPPHSWW